MYLLQLDICSISQLTMSPTCSTKNHPTTVDTVSPRLLVSKILGEVGQFEL